MRFCYVPTYINDQDLTECAYAVFDANPEQIAKVFKNFNLKILQLEYMSDTILNNSRVCLNA